MKKFWHGICFVVLAVNIGLSISQDAYAAKIVRDKVLPQGTFSPPCESSAECTIDFGTLPIDITTSLNVLC